LVGFLHQKTSKLLPHRIRLKNKVIQVNVVCCAQDCFFHFCVGLIGIHNDIDLIFGNCIKEAEFPANADDIFKIMRESYFLTLVFSRRPQRFYFSKFPPGCFTQKHLFQFAVSYPFDTKYQIQKRPDKGHEYHQHHPRQCRLWALLLGYDDRKDYQGREIEDCKDQAGYMPHCPPPC
jgi:hypothetical protein